MKTKRFNHVLVLLLAIVMTITMVLPATVAQGYVQASGKLITTSVENNIAPGIDEQYITTTDSDGTHQNKTYIATVDPSVSTLGILAGYKDYNSSGKWGM